MNKTIITSMVILIFGILLGTKIYETKGKINDVFSTGETYYFLQEGVYTSKELMEENSKEFSATAIEYKNNKYYVYLGITKDEKIAKKIKSIYEEEGYPIYIKEKNISNNEFYNNIIQFDILINSAKTDKEILTIEEVVLANYEEIISNS